MDAIVSLVENVMSIRYDDLPQDVVDRTKMGIMDIIGVLVCGAMAPGSEIIASLVKEWGGKEEATVFVYDGKVPAHNAALVNSVMARALDYDYAMEKGMHLGASSIPTALAVAEMQGGINGKELITAIALGEDIAARVNLATDHYGFDPTGICMVFGTTAIAGRLLGLHESEMLNALGIAFNQAAGSYQANIDGALAVRVIQGLTSKSGILSAILAKRGITGVKNILEGIYGFFQLYSRTHGGGNIDILTNQLGHQFETWRIVFKRYPSCGGTIAATEAALQLVEQYDIRVDDIEDIRVHVTERVYNVAGSPFVIRDNPQVDAQFSIPYTVANALIRGSSKLEHFTETLIADEDVLALAKKVHPVLDTKLKESNGGIFYGCFMEIRTKDESGHSVFIEYPKGFPKNPLGKEDIAQKFQDCLAVDRGRFPKDKVDEIMETVNRLELIADSSHLVNLLVG